MPLQKPPVIAWISLKVREGFDSGTVDVEVWEGGHAVRSRLVASATAKVGQPQLARWEEVGVALAEALGAVAQRVRGLDVSAML